MATIKTPYVVEKETLIAIVVVVVQITRPWTFVRFRHDVPEVARFSSGFMGDTPAKCPIACATSCHIIAVLWQEFVTLKVRGSSQELGTYDYEGCSLWFSRVFSR